MQKPPKVSAVKINGKRAYERFRNNEVFETNKRLVKVYNLKIIDQPNELQFQKLKLNVGKVFM